MAAALATFGVLTGLTLATANPALAAGSTLQPGQALTSGQSLTAPNGVVRLVMQSDGNLVLYLGSTNDAGHALWDTGTWTHPGAYAVMLTNGAFAMYGPNNFSKVISNTVGHPGAYLTVQIDGNVVVYAPGAAPWSTTTGARDIEWCASNEFLPVAYRLCASATDGWNWARGTASGTNVRVSSCDGELPGVLCDGTFGKSGMGSFWDPKLKANTDWLNYKISYQVPIYGFQAGVDCVYLRGDSYPNGSWGQRVYHSYHKLGSACT